MALGGLAGTVAGYGAYKGAQALGLVDPEQRFSDRMATGAGRVGSFLAEGNTSAYDHRVRGEQAETLSMQMFKAGRARSLAMKQAQQQAGPQLAGPEESGLMYNISNAPGAAETVQAIVPAPTMTRTESGGTLIEFAPFELPPSPWETDLDNFVA
jgi:hypothetical protein